MTIQYSEPAASDLANIKRYHAGAEVAESLANRVVTTLERLIARNPRAGRLRPEF
jgi:plasmid stabilization system protein ParE